jgi:hypothetical protein
MPFAGTFGGLQVNGGRNSMVESHPRSVSVAGSSPVGHPIRL